MKPSPHSALGDPTPMVPPVLCAIGDVHGHLQLALAMAARWQVELGVAFDAVFLCGDVGTFTEDAQLDNATRRHGKANPCELEFLEQWSKNPQPPWLAALFMPRVQGGLGLTCPVVMVHGNHEGFAHLARLIPAPRVEEPVPIGALPGVDAAGHLRYLPTGWRCRTPAGLIVGGVGGIEEGQRRAKYHPLAYLDDDAVLRLLDAGGLDVLITHQGPSELQGEHGSEGLQLLLDAGVARVWFHGHSIPNPAIRTGGRTARTLVVPLADVAFPGKGLEPDTPGDQGWAALWLGGGPRVVRGRPEGWREFRQRRWLKLLSGGLVCPPLIPWVPAELTVSRVGAPKR